MKYKKRPAPPRNRPSSLSRAELKNSAHRPSCLSLFQHRYCFLCAKDVDFKHLIALCRTFLHADAARCALRIVRYRNAVHHRDRAFRAGFHADLALNAAHLASLDDACLHDASVRTQHNRTNTGARYERQYFLRTLFDAEAASCTVIVIDVGQPVFTHGQRVEFADSRAIAEALARPGTCLHASCRKLCGAAGRDAIVCALADSLVD